MGGLTLARSRAGDQRVPGGEVPAVLAAVRARAGVVCLLVVLAAGAWLWTARQMAGMDAAPGSDLGGLGWFTGLWIVMMAAMMLPSVSPTVALYARMTRRRGLGRPLLFAGGYLLAWAAVGLAAYGIDRLGASLAAGQLAWAAGGRWLAGGTLAAAALYEVTPLKRACLSKCRSPLGYLLGSWREGWRGALRMGAGHGAWCTGCCWALMGALFALGVMSVTWMALIAALIALEKTLPWGRAARWGTAALLLTLAVALLAAPHAVPGFAVPGNAHRMSTMH